MKSNRKNIFVGSELSFLSVEKESPPAEDAGNGERGKGLMLEESGRGRGEQ